MDEADQIKALTERVERLSGVVAALETLLMVSLNIDENEYLRAQTFLSTCDYTTPIKPPGFPGNHPAAQATEELHKIREIADRQKAFRSQAK